MIAVLALIWASLACVRVDLGARPTPPPSPTPLIWPTLSPWSTPMTAIFEPPEPTCPLPDLRAQQHISVSGSYTETERSASTPMLCHIKRDSCAYNQLVGLLEPTIIFKQAEDPPYNIEDMLVHPAMLKPLARLNQLVRAEWGGAYRLRVTAAYDSLLQHDPPESKPETRYSLHYEGRAVDLTTWPIDQSRYGRLCALAHCAGFDWVLDEGNHCHASIQASSLCTQCSR
jgi:hypothetical protein